VSISNPARRTFGGFLCEESLPKPPPRRVYADNYTVTRDGVEYHPHEGEWVEFVGEPSVRDRTEYQGMLAFARDTGELAGKENPADAEEIGRRQDEYDRRFLALCDRLGDFCVGWTLTDAKGKPYPQPNGDGDTVRALETLEVYWLWRAFRGDYEGPSKNGSSGSANGSIKRQKARSR
jgi:hypothetical protein